MQTAKKLALSIAVLAVFLVYSREMRHEAPVISEPASLAHKSSSPGESAPAASGSAGSSNPAKHYKNGIFTGSVADAFYGNVQVAVTIASGKISDVQFLQYPNTHPTSVDINQQAMPFLKQEAIQAQSSNVQIVTGATFTSQAFQQSLQVALDRAAQP